MKMEVCLHLNLERLESGSHTKGLTVRERETLREGNKNKKIERKTKPFVCRQRQETGSRCNRVEETQKDAQVV